MENSNINFDLKKFTYDYFVNYKYHYIISLVICVFAAFAHIRYSTPKYLVSAQILIKEDSEANNELNNVFELFESSTNVQNEISILNSKSLLKKVIERCNYEVTLKRLGKIRDVELYINSPFRVDFDKLHHQLVDCALNISPLSDSTFRLKVDQNSYHLYDYTKKDFVQINKVEQPDFDTIGIYGTPIVSKNFAFTVHKNQNIRLDIGATNYYFSFRSYQEIINEYYSKLKIELDHSESTILNVSVKADIPKKEIHFLKILFNEYQANQLNKKNQTAQNTVEFIDNQLKQIADSLLIDEFKLEEFKKNNRINDLNFVADSEFENLSRYQENLAKNKINGRYFNYLKEKIEADSSLYITPPNFIDIQDHVLNALLIDLGRLYIQREGYTSNVQDSNPVLNILDKKIKKLQDRIYQQVNSLEVQNNITSKEVENQISLVKQNLEAIPTSQRTLLKYERRFNLNNNLYNFLSEKRSESQIAQAANVQDTEVLDEPSLESILPIYPVKNMVYLISIMFGLVVPFVVVSVKKIFEFKISSIKEITEQLDITCIGYIGHIDKNLPALVVLNDYRARASESFRTLRTNLNYFLEIPNESKIIGITSSESNEGKTFCAINLASSLSLTNKKVVLLEADLRRPSLHDRFTIDNKLGLSSYLIDKVNAESIIVQTGYKNLSVIPSGPIPPNPIEFLSRNQFNVLIKQLKKQFDYIVIDCPPVGIVSDYYAIQSNIDLNIYVIRLNHTPKHYIEFIKEFETKVSKTALLINDVKNRGGNKEYYREVDYY